jgi:purine-binding chemotaxis protein CheW
MSEAPTGMAKSRAQEEGLQFVVFSLAGCECAVDIGRVREIDRVQDLTRMPRAPRHVEGVLNLRGRVVPVLDLRKRFDMPLMERTDESRILVADLQGEWVGLLADKVLGVVRVPPAALLPVEMPVLSLDPGVLRGKVLLEDRLILVLDLERLFAPGAAKSAPEGDREP